MNKRYWLKRVFCIALVALLLLVFCAVGHKCHHDDCPVCLLTASFRLTLGLTALLFGLFCLQCIGLPLGTQNVASGRGGTLVSLKVKLSD